MKSAIENKFNKSSFSKLYSIEDLYSFILEFWYENFPSKKKLKDALIYLALSQKGLTIKEILYLTQFTEQ